jgi:hypothetical protein
MSIITFKTDISNWENDTHWQGQIGHGKWLVSTTYVPPENIVNIEQYNESMVKLVMKVNEKRYKST